MVIKLSSNAIFIRVQLDSSNIPCGPSLMEYPETSGNLRKPAAVVSSRFPAGFRRFLLIKKIEIFFSTNKKLRKPAEDLSETFGSRKKSC